MGSSRDVRRLVTLEVQWMCENYILLNGAAPSWSIEYRFVKRAYMASPQAPPTPISKLSDMTPKLCVQNDPTRCYLHLGSLSNMTRVQVDPVLPYLLPTAKKIFNCFI
ncbi:hypothetical protein OUZ56_026622 [Daphnia magna]|uniref:Uncharacterized protein n=1 Tax=Daphnia magna TaxID=35525 RepID=A0ABQ9ZME0_9CRUS|nr:hypothetical protein OUZ56_026622 [Daphnia magna]